jgi:hypothetical protein
LQTLIGGPGLCCSVEQTVRRLCPNGHGPGHFVGEGPFGGTTIAEEAEIARMPAVQMASKTARIAMIFPELKHRRH